MRGEKRERVCMCGEKLVAAGPSPPFFCRARVLPPCLSQRNTCAARCKFKTRSLAACSPTKPHLLHRFLVRDCRTGRIEGGMTSARSRDIERRRSFNDASSLEEMERRQALHCRGRAWRGLGLGSLEEACLHLVVEGNMEAAKRGERKSERAKGSLSSLPLSPSAFFFFFAGVRCTSDSKEEKPFVLSLSQNLADALSHVLTILSVVFDDDCFK